MDFIFQVQFARQRRVDEGRLLLVVELWPARARLVLHAHRPVHVRQHAEKVPAVKISKYLITS